MKENPYRAAGTFTGISYIEREADKKLLFAIKRNLSFPYCFAPRQSGKSSLIGHTMEMLDPNIYIPLFIDFSKYTSSHKESYKAFLNKFVLDLQRQLQIKPVAYKDVDLVDILLEIMQQVDKKVCVFIDEIESILPCGFKNDFFKNIRSTFNTAKSATLKITSKYKILDDLQFIFFGVAEQPKLIQSISSPFNIAHAIILKNLTYEQIINICSYLKPEFQFDDSIFIKLYNNTNGTIYLVQLILQNLWIYATEQKLTIITNKDFDIILTEILVNSDTIDHFLDIYNNLTKSKENLLYFFKLKKGIELTHSEKVALQLTGISDGTTLFKNILYEIVFGAKGKLSLDGFEKSIQSELTDEEYLNAYYNDLYKKITYFPVKWQDILLKKHINMEQLYITPVFSGGTKQSEEEVLVAEKTYVIKDIFIALNGGKDIIISGEKGSGKTLLLKYLLLLILNKDKDNSNIKKYGDFIPFFLPLNKVVCFPEYNFEMFLVKNIMNEYEAINNDFIKRIIKKEQILFLLDGIDEINDEIKIKQVFDLLKKGKEELKNIHYIITKRQLTRIDSIIANDNFMQFFLCDFSLTEIEDLIKRWFSYLAEGLKEEIKILLSHLTHVTKEKEGTYTLDYDKEAHDFINSIRKQTNLINLLKNPLHLYTAITSYSSTKGLPGRRVDLINELLNTSIGKWEKEKRIPTPLAEEKMRIILQELAFYMHKNKKSSINKSKVLGQIKQYCEDIVQTEISPEHLYTYFIERIYILREKANQVAFSYLLFQEYLTAEYIRNNNNMEILVKNFEHVWWKEVVFLYLTFDNPSMLENFISEIISTESFKNNIFLLEEAVVASIRKPTVLLLQYLQSDKAIFTYSYKYNIIKLLKLIDGKNVISLFKKIININNDKNIAFLCYKALVFLNQNNDITPPRILEEYTTIKNEKDNSFMVLIPEGNFLYGTGENDKFVSDNELPQKELFLDAFYIDAFPVTNFQYCSFLNDTFEKNELIKEWINLDNILYDTDYKIKVKQGKYVCKKGYEDYPVVCVSLYGALAYADWSGKRLPTEEEWEKAARGTDGRTYPWGNTFNSDYANSQENGIEHTTEIYRYLCTPSPFGCFDIAGNNWEWTSTQFRDNLFVLRGGSWDYDFKFCRCSFRGSERGFITRYDLGFRCVKSPV